MSLSHKLFKHLTPLDKNFYYFLNFQPKVFASCQYEIYFTSVLIKISLATTNVNYYLIFLMTMYFFLFNLCWNFVYFNQVIYFSAIELFFI